MGIFSDVFKKANDNSETKLDIGISTQASGLVKEGGAGSASVSITEETAMKIAALNQGVSIIADTIASMPIYLYKDEEGFQQVFPFDPRSKALSNMANEVLTSFNLKRNLIKDLILYGTAYAKIIREKDSVKIEYLPNNIVVPKKDNTGYFFNVQSYSTGIMGEMYPAEVVDFGDMLVFIKNPKFNSLVGTGILEYASQSLDMAIQETNYLTNLFKNGLSAKAVLNSKTPFKKEVKEQLKSDLKEFYSGSENAGKMMVLEGDINVLPLSLTPADIKLIESKHFTISEIARFLNIQKHLLNLDRGQGTYSNITQERLMLLQSTLTPFTVILEEGINQKLLDEKEIKDGTYYFKFNTAEMLKLTPEDQAKYMLDLYKENIVTLEEVRATLNLGGDEETIQKLEKVQTMKEAKVEKDLTDNEGDSVDKETEKPAKSDKDKKAPKKDLKNEGGKTTSDK